MKKLQEVIPEEDYDLRGKANRAILLQSRHKYEANGRYLSFR